MITLLLCISRDKQLWEESHPQQHAGKPHRWRPDEGDQQPAGDSSTRVWREGRRLHLSTEAACPADSLPVENFQP